ncbi:uncharacterized protein [Littorina saxatilis]|uniref:uncharacterized protein n=1 Tax=Littorina saxatilis TaxID=31220 RepID=UPI0038B533BC
MSSDTMGLYLALLLCSFLSVESHVRFVCPRPASVRSDISFTNQSMGYCAVNMTASYETEHLDVRPGLLTLRFEETKYHRNSPFRVSLHSVDSEESCLLLDHIPHNNHASLPDQCVKNGNKYPLGSCDKSTYYITVNIPDIDCDRCFLRVTHIVLDRFDRIPCDLYNGTCFGYVTCAGIKIRPSPAGVMKNISDCVRYEDNLAGDWPFRPMEFYMAEIEVGKDKVDPMVMFDSTHRMLHLDIPRFGFPLAVENVSISLNGSDLWNITVREEHTLPDTVALVWKGMDDDSIDHLKNGDLVLRVNCNKDWYTGNISLHTQNYTEGMYTMPATTDYTSDGWLADYRFRGLYAEDLTVVTPAGPCASAPRYFISFMHPFWKSDVLIHGIMAVSIVGDFADITVVLYGMKDKVTDITILGSELVGAPNLKVPVSRLKDNILQVSLDISTQVPFLDTVQFFKNVRLNTAWPALSLSGNFEEGMFAILREGREVKGIAAFQFTEGQWLKYEILVTNVGSNITRMELTGDSGVAYSASHLNPSFSLVEGLIQDLNSKLLLQLWQGKLMLTVYTNTSILHGMVTPPGSVYCKEARDTACFWLDITPEGKPVKEGQEKVLPSGKAVFLVDGAHALQYSIEINNVESEEDNLEAVVRDGDSLVFTVKLYQDSHHPTTYTDTNHLQVNVDMRRTLAAGVLKVEVFPPSIKPTALRGFIPPIRDHLCVQPKSRIIGDHRGYWSPKAAPFKPLVAIVGDSLVFKYSDNVSLFSFPSKEDLQTCNFSLAHQLSPESVNNTLMTHTVRLDQVQSLFFTSQGHCNASPPLQLSVVVLMPVPPSVGDSTDECGSPVFADWHEEQLRSFSHPKPTEAAIAGVVLGTVIALVFFLWDRRLQNKADLAVPGTRFQRF